MAHGEGALNASVVAVGLVQSGGIAGLDMTATLRLADLPAADADHARGLAEQVLTEPEAPQARTAVYDGLEYELTVTRDGRAGPTRSTPATAPSPRRSGRSSASCARTFTRSSR